VSQRSAQRVELDRAWWKESVVYQLYPRSFNDGNGDGIGDLHGAREKVPYLDDLGVDVVWLNPVYDSPQVDGGYDVRDYYSIDEDYGTMADFDRLLADLHERDMRLVMDLVVNHTSDEHEWFQRSRRGDPEYADYYHWVDGDPDEPPNDWESFFGGPAWSYDEERQAWYLHLFDETQPDLDWQNPAVRGSIYQIMRWWLEKGIDGFRLDVINVLSKPEGYPDADPDADAIVRGADRYVNGPRIHEYLDELYEETLANYDVMTVGEMVHLSVDEAERFTGSSDRGMSMAFTFDHMRLDMEGGRWNAADWSVRDLKRVVSRWQTEFDGWNPLFMNNHDEPRMVSRFGDDEEYHRESATLLATLLYTLRGTPFCYQGEELGMTNYPFESLEEVEDVDTVKNVENLRDRGVLEDDDEVLELVRHRSRDNARTPVQWDDSPNAGFTDDEPWLPVNPNHEEINAARADEDPRSILNYYRRLIELREDHDVLIHGDYELLPTADDRQWVYERTLGRERVLVVLNFCSDHTEFAAPEAGGDLLVANYPDAGPLADTTLRPWEARVYRLS
jgi:oligo-1,6-glucosidase